MSDDGLPCRAFEVKDISDDFDPKAVPSTGEEYLQHVMFVNPFNLKFFFLFIFKKNYIFRFEASNCPQVVVANIDRSKFKNPSVKI